MKKYEGLGIFEEAKQREKDGYGYRARRFKTLWQNKKIGWNWFGIEWGIRWSEKIQIFPIWNASHNCQRSLMFGVWKVYFQIIYHRSGYFNQDRYLPFRRYLWNFWQLIL